MKRFDLSFWWALMVGFLLSAGFVGALVALTMQTRWV